MTRRRVLLLGSVAVVAALAVAALIMLRPSAITSENAEKIKAGMARAEVEAILGGPPRADYDGVIEVMPREGSNDYQRWMIRDHDDFSAADGWSSASVVVRVKFDADGRVTKCAWADTRPQQETFRARVHRWLGL